LIFKYLTEKKFQYGIDNVSTYLKYISGLEEIAKHKDYNELHLKVEKKVNYQLSPMRVIEIVMFETQRKKIEFKNGTTKI